MEKAESGDHRNQGPSAKVAMSFSSRGAQLSAVVLLVVKLFTIKTKQIISMYSVLCSLTYCRH